MTMMSFGNKFSMLVSFLLLIHFPHAYSSEWPTNFDLSRRPVKVFFDAGKKTPDRIRWFADDDFGLRCWLADIRERKIMVSSPYELLPPGGDFIFVGIGAGAQKCRTAELIDFARQGNVAVLLLSPELFSSRQKEISQDISDDKKSCLAHDEVFCFDVDRGRIVLIRDPFAFCNARFSENRALWEYLLRDRKFKAIRIVQKACYARDDRAVFFTSPADRVIPFSPEKDPAFAPSLTDSNNEKYYEMTQNYYFLSERYYADGEEIRDWKSMMRVRAYDDFSPPDENNPAEWHFSISDPRSEPVKIADRVPAGFKKIRIQTGLTRDAPSGRITLASLAPESRLLNVNVHAVEVRDERREAGLAQKIKDLTAASSSQQQKVDYLAWLSLVKPPEKKTKPVADSVKVREAEIQKLQQEYDAVKERNRWIGKGRPGEIIPDAQVLILRDRLNNWTARVRPEGSAAFVIYEVAVPEIYLRRDERDFNDRLIPDHLSVKELCREQRRCGVNPSPVPQHEKDALKRLIGQKRFPWFQQGKAPVGSYLPPCVERALKGEDVPVKDLFSTLSDYARREFKDTDVFMKDEFGSFNEAMLYWKAGVCRHRARLGYMILNTLGIAARCVTTREHAYVEVYLPGVNHGKGGWTYLDFGGGPGAEMPDMPFEIIPASSSASGASAPGHSAPLPSAGPSGMPSVPASGIDLLLRVVTIVVFLFCVIVLMFYVLRLLLFLLRLLRQEGQLRLPVPFEGDFMASLETILADEMNKQEFASAALILMDAAIPLLKGPALRQIQEWRHSIQESMHCSKHRYQEIVNFIKAQQLESKKE